MTTLDDAEISHCSSLESIATLAVRTATLFLRAENFALEKFARAKLEIA
jgi:hypothetical protein